QLDIEMSFINQEELRNLIEELAIKVTEDVLGKQVKEKPFPILSYEEAMSDHGRDDPDLRDSEEEMAYCWVTNFPMFEEKEDGSVGAVHHPFTAVKEEDLEKLEEMKEADDKTEFVDQIYAQQYDLVLNGFEVFGGSIRQHRPEVVKTVFEVLGHTPQEIEEKFGHLLKAFQYGVPPHGGIAAGLDRWLQALMNEKSIREVVAFPTTSSGRTAVMDAPSELKPDKLKELNIKIIDEE
ncbi:MAG: amino acid--tRNA ligase-related protein, partial [Candidatus Paceibacterota bacterium]